MRVGFVEWPDRLEPESLAWQTILGQINSAHIDLLITNELPFGRWLAAEPAFDPAAAQASIDSHIRGLEALRGLSIPAIVSSRPVWAGDRLANEAFALEAGVVRPLHRKHYFPAEPGWFETSWFVRGEDPFTANDVGGVRTGVLLCTDAMFNEHARHYGRESADLIAIPRATGFSIEMWLAAGKMAAIVSGGYVVSSNRVADTAVAGANGDVHFGGAGFAFHPDGSLLAMTSAAQPLRVIEVDPAICARQRREYPCYVR